jgi:putative nucleotidyltransferase with HDIG domain
MDLDDRFPARVLQVFAMLLAAAVYLKLQDPKTLESNSRLALIVLLVLLNLGLVRLTITLGQLPYFIEHPGAASALPYLAPVTLAPLFLTILLGSGPGIFMALVVSFFSGVIHSGRLDVMVLSFLGSLVAIYGCQAIRLRAHVVRAGALSGAAVAVLALLIGVVEASPPEVTALQMLTGFATCTLCGFLVIGMLPVFESLFGRTTDITLLELTDYNHPLLRRLQIEAPGTYHHSLVVANLAENAAAAIGANGLLARVCALFHDIGKMVKPEYFTENQRGSHNPHDQRNPSMSALIIKSHVKEGVSLAQEHRLPKPVVDTIRQHHGTTLMQFFFTRARERLRGAKGQITEFPAEQVPEGVYRYDGPKPQFRESAILHLADSVEACSRSLRKVTAQSVAEMVEEITEMRVADGQLDECPLTLEELSKIKGSFTFTLLNMLHGRVSYAQSSAAPPKVESAQATDLPGPQSEERHSG